ncbi:tRNA-His guanylyltransferase [Microsporum ferrugineum]
MANSKYEYVRNFEQSDVLLPNTWIVIRIDGRGFHKLVYLIPNIVTIYGGSAKPNDRRALDLMNSAAQAVMRDIPDLIMAYGVSDEFSFVFHPNCQLFERRSSKLVSTIVSTFTAHYAFKWISFFPDTPLEPTFLPTFDGRAVQYPSVKNLRDYMSWRQVDCHINNLYNTTFWNMVQKGGMSNQDAEQELKGTVSSDKNEILFSRYGINYNNELEIFKKGSVLFRDYELEQAKSTPASIANTNDDRKWEENVELTKTQLEKHQKLRRKANVAIAHVDIIKDEFWEQRPWLLSNIPGRLPSNN